MSARTSSPFRSSFPGGVHPAERKLLSADIPIEVLPTPQKINVPLLQHLGAPCTPTVKPRDELALGDVVGRAESLISAPVHASVAGKVSRLTVATLPNGRHVQTIPILAGEQPLEGEALLENHFGGEWPLAEVEQFEPQEIAAGVLEAGIVGMGGAAFPTHVKMRRDTARPIDTLVVNGCECEPYLTADYRLMLEAPQPILAGAMLAARACGAARILVGIEDNKPSAIRRLREAAAGSDVEIGVVRTKYPQGAEKQLILALLARKVPSGGLPLDIGVVVINVATAAAIARAMLRSAPLTHRVITVTGLGIAQPKNLLAPIGAPIGELLAFAGGLEPNARRLISGGPMMGFTLGTLSTPVTKGTSGITVLSEDDLQRTKETACLRCGRCVDVCPLNLVPTKIAMAARHGDWDLARTYHIKACMECGCCAFECPAQIPLVQLIRMGKAHLAGAA